MVVAVGEGFVGPSGVVSDVVVVAAEGDEVRDGGGAAVGVGCAVVEVAARGGHAASGEDTGRVAGLDESALAGGGPPPGGTAVGGLSGIGVGDGEAPLTGLVLFGDVSGDVGDDGPVAGQLAGMVAEIRQGFEVDTDFDDTSSPDYSQRFGG
ncbi:hypothetical protein BMS3Bbin01_00853 [bacterium BMS3Bbin01]|nr:hypothetical protein BMS3Bbin01_00853 [bacterium BMS3Bbin01]